MKDVKLLEKDIDDILNGLDYSIDKDDELARLDHIIFLLDNHEELLEYYLTGETNNITMNDDIEELFFELDKYVDGER